MKQEHMTAIIFAKRENAKSPCTKNAKDYKVIKEEPHEVGTMYVVQFRITGRHAGTTSMNIVLKDD